MPKNFAMTDKFTIMETQHTQVFMYISDHTLAEEVGNLFISDNNGVKFAHSVANIIKGEGGAVDFEAV